MVRKPSSSDAVYSIKAFDYYKTSKYMLGGLSTSGNYQPTYLDYQTFITWCVAPKWSMSFLGNVSQNDDQFAPDSLSES